MISWDKDDIHQMDQKPVTNDPVNHPSHYTMGKVECIEAIEASMTHEEFIGYLKGNTLKYLWRYRDKAKPAEDLAKARFYLDLLRDKVGR